MEAEQAASINIALSAIGCECRLEAETGVCIDNRAMFELYQVSSLPRGEAEVAKALELLTKRVHNDISVNLISPWMLQVTRLLGP